MDNKAKIFRDDGEAFQRWGNLEEAERCYLKALDCEGGDRDHQTLYRMSELFLEKKNPSLALQYYIMAIQANRSSIFHKQRFLDINGAMHFAHHDADVEDVLFECLKSRDLDFTVAGPMWFTLLINNPELSSLYRDRQIFEKRFNPSPLLRPYFLEGLKKVSVCNADFEDFIRRLRQWLLMGASSRSGGTPADFLRLAEALAAYCFYSGYIIKVTAAERARLKEESADGQHGDPLSMAIRACYTLQGVTNVFDPDSALGIILKEKEEAKTQDVISPLPVSSEGGLFPLACWRAAPVHTLRAQLFFPLRKEKMERTFAGTRPELLIAGCGTGREAVITALYYPKGKITAIDSSREKIAYAAVKARGYGVENIAFRQDVIINLAKIPKPYDIIYSDTLHHEPEPIKAWQILWDNLKPAGIMKIGLPSKAAQVAVVNARGVIGKYNIRDNHESVLEFRMRSPELLSPETLASLMARKDYYNLPAYRELLFHPEGNRCFTLSEIESALSELRLIFEGFDLPADVLRQYAEKFPNDPDMTSLRNWHEFEQAAPDTFGDMYRFWCRKV